MSVSRDEVLRIAELAELAVDDESLPVLADQLSKILDYVAQLNAVQAGDTQRPFLAGPDLAALRPDEVRPQPLALPPGALAPEFRDGLFLVPRLGAHAGAEAGEEGEEE